MSQFRSHWFRLALAALLGLMLIGTFGAPQVARAVEYDDDGIIAADEVIDDDVFLSGDTVIVDGTVNGNLFVSANNAKINGMVGGDLIVSSAEATFNGQVDGSMGFVGQSLSFDGAVEGSLFFLGFGVVLGPSAAVNRNLFFAGFSLDTEPGSMIGRDVQATGFQALFAGQINRNVNVEMDALEIRGSIGGDVMVKAGNPKSGPPELGPSFMFPGSKRPMIASGLRVTKDAQIGGTLTYSSPVEQADAIEAVPEGGVVYESLEPEIFVDLEWQAHQWVLGRLQELLTLLVLGCLAAWRLPALLSRLADQARAKPLPAVGWGMVVLIGGSAGVLVLAGLIFILAVLLGVVTLGELAFATLGVGFSGLGLALMLFWLIVAYGSKLVVIYSVGKRLLQRFAPRYADGAIWPLMLGLVLLPQ